MEKVTTKKATTSTKKTTTTVAAKKKAPTKQITETILPVTKEKTICDERFFSCLLFSVTIIVMAIMYGILNSKINNNANNINTIKNLEQELSETKVTISELKRHIIELENTNTKDSKKKK